MFVIPSIIIAFILSFPSLALCYKSIFKEDLNNGFAPVPTVIAVLEAIAIGLFIPFISSIVPIMRVLG
jgi:hypothetical protein